MNILITGKNGFIGGELARFFANTEHCVFATCRKTLDVSNEFVVDKYFEENNIDIVLHTAIKGGHRTKKDTYFDLVENLIMFKNLYKHRKQYKMMISFGSGAERETTNYYGLAKNIIASEIRKCDGNIFNLRIFGCFGSTESDTRFIKNSINRVIKGQPITVHQDKHMDYFYIDDLKEVVLYYIQQRNEDLPREVDLCYERDSTLLEIAMKIKDLTDLDARIIIEDNAKALSYVGSPYRLMNLDIELGGLEHGIKKMIDELKT